MEYNAQTSTEITGLFITSMDESGVILTQSDINALNKNGANLLSEIKDGKQDFREFSTNIFKHALLRADSVLTVLSNKPMNFKENDTIHFLPANSKPYYSPTPAYHAGRIARYIKNICYERVTNLDNYEKLDEKEFIAKAQEFSVTAISKMQEGIREILKDAGKTIEAALLNAIALRYDPHSNYFTNEQNKEFSRSLSSKIESFGFALGEDENGNVIISEIEPGGSAWLSNQVNEGDFFLSVKIGSEKYGTEDKKIEEIESKLNATDEKNIFLTVKKPNGQVKTIKLVKQKVASEENTVKGYVLKSGKIKSGYISLPSFYTDMENDGMPGCANDVAKEILKLEKDSIQGLILDLRNNGGGSMQEAMNLAGIFIDEGPLFIYKEKNRKPTLMKDINRGSIFKKPLVLIINETSASASELLANIVKDYNIGVVVGQSSYGKGTAQAVLPLDTNLITNPRLAEISSDYIKMTDGKFYRLNGSTHQGVGVMPDVPLPQFPAYTSYKESKEAFYIKPDSVVKKVIYNPNAPFNITQLKERSKKRIEASPDFKRFNNSADSLQKYLNSPRKVPLKYKEFKKYRMDFTARFNSFENACLVNDPSFKCIYNTFDEKLNTYNAEIKEFNDNIKHDIESDLIINETFYILADIINP
jgi:carboxyl-terminal processing protease